MNTFLLFSLTNANPDTKLLDEKTREIEQGTAALNEKDQIILQQEEKLTQERKKTEQVSIC